MNRRTVLAIASTVGSVAVAGCTEDTLDPTSSGDDSGDGGSDGSDTDGATGGVQYEESFVMEMTGSGSAMDGTGGYTMRVNGKNSRLTVADQNFEIRFVDGDLYQIVGGQCFKNPGDTETPALGPAPKPGEEWDPTADLPGEPDRRETIDGEEMLVYAYDPETSSVYEGDELTAYVSADTGYLRRVEASGYTIDYHSWGEVDPIEAPDMECRDISGGIGGGDSDDY